MCFQLGLTSIHLTTLAAPVFMLLLLEGAFSFFPSLEKGVEQGSGPPTASPALFPSHSKGSFTARAVHFPLLSPSLGLLQPLEALLSVVFLLGMLNVLICC